MKSHELKSYTTFKKMNISPELFKGIINHGFSKPSDIQKKGVMPIIEGDDVIIQAKSGSGKTATFCIGILGSMDFSDPPQTQAIVLAPTRELAQQICIVFESLSEFMHVKGTVCCGGTTGADVGKLVKELNKGQHVIVGTPGRVLDMMIHGHIKTDNLSMLILDEADEMMAQGLREQLENIYRRIMKAVQVIIVSATMPKSCLELAERFQTDPVKILVKSEKLTVQSLRQYYINVVCEENKFSTLSDIYMNNAVHQTIIFVNTRDKADWLEKKMRSTGHNISCVHGQKPQEDREKLMTQFRSMETRVLICTDVWARGIDVHTVNLVVNYDMPKVKHGRNMINKEVYLHRIGRSGRFERKGVAVSLVTQPEMEAFKGLAVHYKIDLKAAPKNLKLFTNFN